MLTQFNTVIKAELASEGKKILTETQLKNFIEKYSNQKYSEFAPQSARYGYHVFFDIEKQQFVLSLIDQEPLENEEEQSTAFLKDFKVFADEIEERKEVKCDLKDNVFRNSIKEGYYFVDRNNSTLSNIITTLEYPTSGEEYQDSINQLMGLVNDADEKEKESLINLQKALRSTVIMNEYGIFRYFDVIPDDNGKVHLLICDNENPITLSNELHLNYEEIDEEVSISNNVIDNLEISKELPTLTKEFEGLGIIDIPENVIANDLNTFFVDENASIVLRIHVNNQEELKEILGEEFQGTNAHIVINDIDNLGEEQSILEKKNNLYVTSGAKVKDITCLLEATFKYLTGHGWKTVVKTVVKGLTPVEPIIDVEITDDIADHKKFVFSNWTINDEAIDEITPIFENTTFIASYNEELLSYNVTYYYKDEDGNRIDIDELNNNSLYNKYTYSLGLDLPTEYSIDGKVLDYWILIDRIPNTVIKIPTNQFGDVEIEGNFVNATRFESNIPDAFLYRVGNENFVNLSYLFRYKSNEKIDANKLTVVVENIAGNSNGIYTKNTDNWENSSIKFNNSGVVKVTLTYDKDDPVEIYLEVVNAKNVTQYSEFNSKWYNVLLKDITIAPKKSNEQICFTNGGIYGNGYTFDVRNGKNSDEKGNEASNYVIGLKNSILDNINIVGEVYTTYGKQTKDSYNFPCILVDEGESIIANSYISNCAAPVRTRGGANLYVKNTILKGGSFCNLDIRSGSKVTADGLTTINQVNGNDASSDNRIIVGLGIVFYYEGLGGKERLDIIGNGINQYNFIAEDQKINTVSEANTYYSTIFKNIPDKYKYYKDTSRIWINTGIISLDASQVAENNITKINSYTNETITEFSRSVYFYAREASSYGNLLTIDPPKFKAKDNYPIEPIYSFEYPTVNGKKNYVAKIEDNPNYCYWDSSRKSIMIGFEKGNKFTFDTDIITINKNGYTITPDSIKVNGVTCSNKYEFTESGEYTISYTYTDPYNYSLNGIQTQPVTYTKTINITVVKADKTLVPAIFDFNGKGYKKVTGSNNVTYVMPNIDSSDVDGLNYVSKNIGGQTVYYPVVCVRNGSVSSTTSINGSPLGRSATNTALLMVFDGIVTIVDNGKTYDSSNTNMADGKLTALEGNLKSALVWSSSNSYDTDPDVVNNKQCYKSASIQGVNRTQENHDIEYIYTDEAGNVYHYYVKYVFPSKGTGTNNYYNQYYQADSTFTITINCGENGSVNNKTISNIKYGSTLTVDGNKLKNGNTVIATASPNTNYVAQWQNVPSNVVTGNITIDLNFKSPVNVTINCGEGGSVNTNSFQTKYGSSLTIDGDNLKIGNTIVATSIPNTNYLTDWSNIPSIINDDITINLNFIPPVMININCGEGGSINKALVPVIYNSKLTIDGNNLKAGNVVVATAKPNEGKVSSWSNIPTSAITSNTTVNVDFVSPVTITISTGTNGSVSPTSVKVAPGKKLTTSGTNLLYDGVVIATATASNNYEIDSWSGVPSTVINSDITVSVTFKKSCVIEGTLITMADGTYKPVEEVVSGDMLLVYNFNTGSYDSSAVLFNDEEILSTYRVINLEFSDGTNVGVVSEHGFFDYTLGEFIYLDENASEYIGHEFIKDTGSLEIVTLTNVTIEDKETRVYSPVTYKHLNYFTNDMLSMPGGIKGLFNIFEVDTELMMYDKQAMENDIATYGLLTIEDYDGLINQEAFDAYNGEYLGVAIGKGLLTKEYIQYLAERYIPLMK